MILIRLLASDTGEFCSKFGNFKANLNDFLEILVTF